MQDIWFSILESLDGKDPRVLPYLPFLLQDLWELGSSPGVISGLVKRHAQGQDRRLRVLDLGCGKGTVSVQLACDLECEVDGVDAMPDFVTDARALAERRGVGGRCRFDTEDLRVAVDYMSDYDAVILGSVGPVLGNLEETVLRLQACSRPDGLIVIDDACRREGSSSAAATVPERQEALAQIARAGAILVEEVPGDPAIIEKINRRIIRQIRRRAEELALRRPEKAPVFEAYVEAQIEACASLESEVVCVTWAMKKPGIRQVKKRATGRSM
jgi:2-polyprenyl-3-methyl-5-hydroxy-6-metoxy-1,4-benzoquinol methylase